MPKPLMLDRLPNELLFDLFEYLTTYQILYAFRGLNERLQIVVAKYLKCDLHFKSWPKSKFDFVCDSIRPEQVRSLTLSDADDTCQQVSLFFQFFPLQRFTNLESFALIDITEQELNKLLSKLNHLINLSSLTIKLAQGAIPKITVPTLKTLSVGVCSMMRLEQLLSYMPLLTNLKVELITDTTPTGSTSLTGKLTTNVRQLRVELAKKSNIAINDIEVLFSWMPRLEKFAFAAVKGLRFIRAEQWEHLVRTYVPTLKAFRFKIHPHLYNTNISQLVAAFRTPFWLTENQWFVNCDHHHRPTVGYHDLRSVHLYTLPYSGEVFYLSLSAKAEPNVRKEDYRSVKHLLLSIDCHFDTKIIDRFYFPNLDSLTILNLHKLLPIANLIDFSRIQHLTIQKNNAIHSEEFLSYILAHSTKLQSLTLSWRTLAEITKNYSDPRVCFLLKAQIKSVFLSDTIPEENNRDKNQALEILSGVFSRYLEKLSFSVTSIESALAVLNGMFALHSVSIECNPFDTRVKNQEWPLSAWLPRHVPRLKNFTCQIRTISDARVQLLLWIGD